MNCASYLGLEQVIDMWVAGGESFRLIDPGAGPSELQVLKDGKWAMELPIYTHGILCHRIATLRGVIDRAVLWSTKQEEQAE